MRSCVRMIKLYLAISAISLLCAYAVELNIAFGLIRLGSPLLSNDFVRAVSLGVFTGSFVALLVEVSRYQAAKSETEKRIRAYCGGVIGCCGLVAKAMGEARSNVRSLPSNFSKDIGGTVEDILAKLLYADYYGFADSEKRRAYWSITSHMRPGDIVTPLLGVHIAITEYELRMMSAGDFSRSCPADSGVCSSIQLAEDVARRYVEQCNKLLEVFSGEEQGDGAVYVH